MTWTYFSQCCRFVGGLPDSQHIGPVVHSFDGFFVLSLDKPLKNSRIASELGALMLSDVAVKWSAMRGFGGLLLWNHYLYKGLEKCLHPRKTVGCNYSHMS